MKSWVFYNQKQLTGEEKELFLVDIYKGDITTFETDRREKNKRRITTLLDPTPKGLAERITKEPGLEIGIDDPLTSIRALITTYGNRNINFPATPEQMGEFLIEYEKLKK